jgi:hypothetical protein
VLIKDIDDILMNLQRRDKIYIYISEIYSEQNLLKSKLKALKFQVFISDGLIVADFTRTCMAGTAKFILISVGL